MIPWIVCYNWQLAASLRVLNVTDRCSHYNLTLAVNHAAVTHLMGVLSRSWKAFFLAFQTVIMPPP